MATEEDHREISQLLSDFRERVGLVVHKSRALEQPEQRRVCLSRELLELLKNPTFRLFYPEDR